MMQHIHRAPLITYRDVLAFSDLLAAMQAGIHYEIVERSERAYILDLLELSLALEYKWADIRKAFLEDLKDMLVIALVHTA